MALTIVIPETIFSKGIKFKENEIIDWSQKSLKEQTEAEVVVEVADTLGIEAKAIFKHLKADLGEFLKEGQVLAEKKGLFGGQKVLAPKDAEVRGINHEDGTVTLAVNETTDVPFGLKAKFVKKEKGGNLLFEAARGVEIPVQTSLDTNFGGQCSYISSSGDVTIDNCERKIIVSEGIDLMDQAKMAALGPMAVVSYEASYHDLAVPLLLLEDKSDWQSLFAKKYHFCLYLQGGKTVYFYNP
jgi:hypothetical protein